MLLSSPRLFVSAVHFWCFEVPYDRSEPFNVIKISKTTRRSNFTFCGFYLLFFRRDQSCQFFNGWESAVFFGNFDPSEKIANKFQKKYKFGFLVVFYIMNTLNGSDGSYGTSKHQNGSSSRRTLVSLRAY